MSTVDQQHERSEDIAREFIQQVLLVVVASRHASATLRLALMTAFSLVRCAAESSRRRMRAKMLGNVYTSGYRVQMHRVM